MGNTKSAVEEKFQKLRAGMASVIPSGSSLLVEGQNVTQPQLLAKIDAVLSLYTTSDAAKLQATAAVAAIKNAAEADQAFFLGVKAALQVALGSKSPQLAQFGLSPKVARAQATVEVKTVAAAKRKATRKLRNPLTQKEKAAIPPVQGISLQILGPAAATPAATTGAATSAPAVTAASVATPISPKS